MRDGFAVGTEVALLVENDLVDEAPQARIALGGPGYVDAGEADLERFDQREEVPYREDVRREKDAQRFRALDARKEPMRNELLLEIGDVDGLQGVVPFFRGAPESFSAVPRDVVELGFHGVRVLMLLAVEPVAEGDHVRVGEHLVEAR